MTERRALASFAFACFGCIEQNPAWIAGDETGAQETTASDASAQTATSSDITTTGGASGESGEATTAVADTSADASESGPGGCAAVAWEFQRCPDGWSVEKAVPEAESEPTWECGEAVSGPGPDGHPGQWATDLDGNYLDNESSALISPSFDLSACTVAELIFEHFWEFEGGGGNNDGGILEVSTDGGRSWVYVMPEIGGYFTEVPIDTSYPPVDGQLGYASAPGAEFFVWTVSQLDLAPFIGNADVRVRFVFGSDPLVESSGWYIDRVEIAGT